MINHMIKIGVLTAIVVHGMETPAVMHDPLLPGEHRIRFVVEQSEAPEIEKYIRQNERGWQIDQQLYEQMPYDCIEKLTHLSCPPRCGIGETCMLAGWFGEMIGLLGSFGLNYFVCGPESADTYKECVTHSNLLKYGLVMGVVGAPLAASITAVSAKIYAKKRYQKRKALRKLLHEKAE